MNGHGPMAAPLRAWFGKDGLLKEGPPEAAVEELWRLAATELPELRVSQELAPWLESRRSQEERKLLRCEYALKEQRANGPCRKPMCRSFRCVRGL
jgi:hypothetical protein